MNQRKRAVFVTFNVLGYAFLEELIASEAFEFVAIYTLDTKYTAGKSDYKDIAPLCTLHGLSLRFIKNINEHAAELAAMYLDYLFVMGWSQIVGPSILSLPKNGCIGSHPALLPRNRGRAAIPWHFIKEEKYGGMTVFFLGTGCDDGDILGQRKFRLTDQDTARTYYDRAVEEGRKILNTFARDVQNDSVRTKKQDNSKATYLLIRTEADSYLDFKTLSARQVFNQVRAVAHVYPTAFAFFKDQKVKVFRASMIPRSQQVYSALPGQIIEVSKDVVWVQAADEVIALSEIVGGDDQPIECKTFFKVGHHFNRND